MATHNVFTLSNVSAMLITPEGATAGRDFTVQNVSAGYVYIGASDTVSSTSYGFRLDPNSAWSVELNGKDEIWAIAAVDGGQVATFALGLETVL